MSPCLIDYVKIIHELNMNVKNYFK